MKPSANSEPLDDSFFDSNDPSSQQVVFGLGCSARAGEFAAEMGARALVVSDAGVLSAGHPQKIADSLRASGLEVVLYDSSMENPSDASVRSCAATAREAGVDLIVGVGGGSSLDTAKGANFILTNGGSMKDYHGVGKAAKPLLPMMAVPTTAGTGSECQSYALISDDLTRKKMACGDPGALPRVTLLDPELTLSQPFSVCAATGFDALAHALESAVTTRRNHRSGRHAQKAFVCLINNLETVWSDPSNLDARGSVLLGAAHAGAAIERSMLGAAHALANPLTALKGVVHGRAVALTLPAVLSYNRRDPRVVEIYAELSRLGGLAGYESTDEAAVDALVEKVVRLRALADLPARLSEVDCQASELGVLARDAAEQWTGTFNPRPVGETELRQIYRSMDEWAKSLT